MELGRDKVHLQKLITLRMGGGVMAWLTGREASSKAQAAVQSQSKSKAVPCSGQSANSLARRDQGKGALGTVEGNSPISFPRG